MARLTQALLMFCACAVACGGDGGESLEAQFSRSDAVFEAFCEQVEACYGPESQGTYSCSVPIAGPGTAEGATASWGRPPEGGEAESRRREVEEAYRRYPDELIALLDCLDNEEKVRTACLADRMCPRDATPCIELAAREDDKCLEAASPALLDALGGG